MTLSLQAQQQSQRSATVYDSNLTADHALHLTRPITPSRSPFKDVSHRRSPTKQIRSAKANIDYDEFHKIVDSRATTAAEKELATRVVRAAEKLREWCKEIESWGWSGSFQGGSDEDQILYNEADLVGSISPKQMDVYDMRLDSISDEFRSLDVDELKEQILGIHTARSRPSSSYSMHSASALVLYDDFQLFVTEALIYSLPYNAKLHHYLKTWSTRLAVLAEVPSFLSGLTFLNEILREAWHGLQNAATPERNMSEVNELERQLETAQNALRSKVADLGSQLDRMLDILEGCDDCLPDTWIDNFETNEKSYGDWSYAASRKLLQLKLLEGDLAREAQRKNSEATVVVPPHELSDSDPFSHASASNEESDRSLRSSYTSMSDSAPVVAVIESKLDRVNEPVVQNDPSPKDESAQGIELDMESEEEAEIVQATVMHQPVEAAFRRASVASIGSFTRDQVKSVNVSRRNSASSFSSQNRRGRSVEPPLPASSPVDAAIRKLTRQFSSPSSPLANESNADGPILERSVDGVRPYTPSHDVRRVRDHSVSSVASFRSEASNPVDEGEESPSARAQSRVSQMPRGPINYSVRKQWSTIDMEESASDPAPIETSFPIPPSTTKSKSPISPTVPLDEQISNILEAIPAPIRLESGASPSAAEIKSRKLRASHVDPRSAAPRSRAGTPALSSRPTITLAPADDVVSRRSGANDPEIRLYHLTSGNEKPIKLFVRRVGENGERVMVRVGGGWADLAEYLRTYAEHHGRRVVSDGTPRIEVLGLANVDREGARTPNSGGRDSRAGMRSDSRQSIRADSRQGFRTDSRQGMRSDISRRSSLISSAGYNADHPMIDSAGMASPLPDGNSPVFHTPDVHGPSNRFTPGSTDSSRHRSGSFWEDGGLMGPHKKGEMSEEKKEWVDGIVEQAKRTVSVNGKKVEFGDLGKTGGTRRVFLKGKEL